MRVGRRTKGPTKCTAPAAAAAAKEEEEEAVGSCHNNERRRGRNPLLLASLGPCNMQRTRNSIQLDSIHVLCRLAFRIRISCAQRARSTLRVISDNFALPATITAAIFFLLLNLRIVA